MVLTTDIASVISFFSGYRPDLNFKTSHVAISERTVRISLTKITIDNDCRKDHLDIGERHTATTFVVDYRHWHVCTFPTEIVLKTQHMRLNLSIREYCQVTVKFGKCSFAVLFCQVLFPVTIAISFPSCRCFNVVVVVGIYHRKGN